MLRQLRILGIASLIVVAPFTAQVARASTKAAKVAPQNTPRSANTPQDRLKADVKAFVTTLNSKNALPFLATKYVHGARIGFFGGSEWLDWWRRENTANEFEVVDVKIHKITAADAEASFSYRRYANAPAQNAGPFALKLDHSPSDLQRKESKVWQFVPQAPLADQTLTKQPMLWAVWMLSQSPESLPTFRTQLAFVNLIRLGEGVRKFEQDFEGYVFSPAFQEEALKAYLHHDTVWLVPGTKEKFLFNHRLSGKTFDQIAEPSRTVLFYDGSDEKPIFRDGERTFVCLADGHVELADANRFKAFVWQ